MDSSRANNIIVFQSYQDNILIILKVVCNVIPFRVVKIPSRAGLELGIARSAGRR